MIKYEFEKVMNHREHKALEKLYIFFINIIYWIINAWIKI